MFFRLALALCGMALIQCRDAARTHNWFAMDSNMAVTLYGSTRVSDDSAFARMEAETERLNVIFSDFSTLSALSAVKGNVGDTLAIHPEIYRVLAYALEMSRASNGAFDLTMHDLKSLWGIGTGQEGRVPDSSEIDSVMKGNPIYHAPLAIDSVPVPLTLIPGNRAVLLRDHVQLDLGGIAKGYIVDCLHALLDSLGCPNHIIQAGGEIRLGGSKKSGPWKVGIRHPRVADSVSGFLKLKSSRAISTSGDYERYFDKHGVRYHHIFDPRTGRPSPTVCAVTVVTDSGLHSDAITKPLFILGPELGAILARKYHASAVWFFALPSGICAVSMPEMDSLLTLTLTPRPGVSEPRGLGAQLDRCRESRTW
ncbi:MAG: FAD:protein FMN transferase [Fibrobacteria bacterium]